jgi:hypothetical protein
VVMVAGRTFNILKIAIKGCSSAFMNELPRCPQIHS